MLVEQKEVVVLPNHKGTRSGPGVNLTPEYIVAWCKTALFFVKTVISIIRAVQHPPFNLAGFPAS
jgi:hypothetical protein